MYKVIEKQTDFNHNGYLSNHFESFEETFPTFAQASAYVGERYREFSVDEGIGEWKQWFGANLKGMCFEAELYEPRENINTNVVVYICKA